MSTHTEIRARILSKPMADPLEPFTIFREDVRRAINEAISRLDPGTVGIGRDCLWQLTRIKSQYGPIGTNAAWVARQVFNEIISENQFKSFLID